MKNLLSMQPRVFDHVILMTILKLPRSWGGTLWNHGRDHLTLYLGLVEHNTLISSIVAELYHDP
jgi:hypothetical protein